MKFCDVASLKRLTVASAVWVCLIGCGDYGSHDVTADRQREILAHPMDYQPDVGGDSMSPGGTIGTHDSLSHDLNDTLMLR